MNRSVPDQQGLPNYYHRLMTKQKRHWRRNSRRNQRNDKLKERYPPFYPTSETDIVHIHYRTTIEELDELISKAMQTQIYTVDTESENHRRGALVQVEMIHSIRRSTVLLFEVHYFPKSNSLLLDKIYRLCSIIFDGEHEIIS